MANAVKQALEQHSPRISVFSQSQPDVDLRPVGEFWSWQLEPVSLPEESHPRPRLMRGVKSGIGDRYPSIDLKLWDVLRKRDGKFETYTEQEPGALPVQISTCPDVVVFDDLGVVLRTSKFDSENLDEKRVRLRKKPQPNDATETKRQRFEDVLSLLFERFQRAKVTADEQKLPVQIPIILIVCVYGPSE